MYQQKCDKRFSTSSDGKNKPSNIITISSSPNEKVPEVTNPKSPKSLPICVSASNADTEKYERRRYGRYFSRFSQKSPVTTSLNVVPRARSSTGSISPDVTLPEHITKKDLELCLKETLEEWKKMIPEFAKEISKHIINNQDSVCLLPESKIKNIPSSGSFIPFFNSPENKTIHSKTTLDENGYIHLQVGLAGCLFSEEILIYPFGLEKISLTVGNNQLKMQFKTTEGKIGEIVGTLFQNDEGIYVIRVKTCLIETQNEDSQDEETTKIVDFSSLDLPLEVTFEGGLI